MFKLQTYNTGRAAIGSVLNRRPRSGLVNEQPAEPFDPPGVFFIRTHSPRSNRYFAEYKAREAVFVMDCYIFGCSFTKYKFPVTKTKLPVADLIIMWKRIFPL